MEDLSAREYYAHADELRATVLDAYEDLASRFDVIVIEGAGSVTELNLRDHDLVNLGLVTRIRAPWLLVADIERGGVFGSVIGTAHLLTPDERSLFRGFAINKFRGDVTLFDEGVRILEERTASHCFGVFPYAPDIHLDAEDSLALETRPRTAAPPGARIAIVRFPHLSNATDFRLLTWADWVTSPPQGRLRLRHPAGQQEHDRRSRRGSARSVWRTGSWTSTARARRSSASAAAFRCSDGAWPIRRASNPTRRAPTGLGLLPATTTLTREKRTRAVRATTAGRRRVRRL